MERPSPSSVNWIYPIVAIAALAMFGVGLYMVLVNPHEWTMLAAGCLAMVMVGVAWPLAHALSSARSTLIEGVGNNQRLGERLDQIANLLARLGEQQLLSDRAKSVAYREKDRDAIRRAINEEIGRREWEAAFALADQFEQAFGSKSEADRFRAEIRDRRAQEVQSQISEVVAVVDRFTRDEQWTAAFREAERLQARFPDDEHVRQLPQEIENRRQNHKKQLLQSWHEAVARHDVDGSIEILKQLDTYLTPAEAEAIQDTARGVFKERLNNLGAQFAAAIREHRWAEAMRIGDLLQREFPNSRAAQEVREKMDTLKQRAGGEPAAAVV